MKVVAECLDCGAKRQVSSKEWIRAARPRCYDCGGPVEPSESARERYLLHTTAQSNGRPVGKGRGRAALLVC